MRPDSKELTYPLAYSKSLSGISNQKRSLSSVPRRKVVLLSLQSGVNSWFAPVEVMGITFDFLVDTGASKSIITRKVYDSLPNTKPKLQPTNISFELGSGDIHPALGICHLPITMRFGKITRSITMPIFVCDHLSSTTDCIFGLDAGMYIDFILEYSTGILRLLKDPDDNPLLCTPKLCTHDDSLHARVLNRVVIKPESFAAVEVGTRKSMPPKEWRHHVLCTCDENLYEAYGATMLQGLADFTKGPATVCIINTTDQDLILKSGLIVANLAPVDKAVKIKKSEPHSESKKGEDVLNLNSLFPYSTDGSKREDNLLPKSIFNIVPSECSKDFSSKERKELVNLFCLKTCHESEEDSDMSDFEDDMDIISYPLATPRSKPLGKGKLPESLEKLLANCEDDISEEQMIKARELVESMTDTFMDPSVPLVGTNAVAHYIDTNDTRPIRVPPRRIPPGRRNIIEEEVTKMLQAGVIRASDSPWSSPIVLVKKKDGTIRFCIDYRLLNEATRKNSYPLPRIDDNLEALKDKSWFCTLDLATGYWQIKMDDADVEKTAFASHVGLYEFLKMPYGLTNAPATFQCLMERVLKGFIGTKCLLYLDDVIVYGNTFEEVLNNLRAILLRMREYNLKLKAKKCSLFKRRVNFLGHIVSENGRECDPGKIEKIQNLPPPKTKTGVRAILGLGNYYRRFIKGYASIAAPLQRLTKMDVDFIWTDKEQEALDNLKKAFCSAPILGYPDHEGEFIVDTDASNYAIGGVLSQVQDGKERVIMYGSKGLVGSQQKWCTTRRELWAIVHFVTKQFSFYLQGREFKLRTDHSSLRWLKSFHDKATDVLARWLYYLEAYRPYMKIEHRAGEKHGNADALSRFETRSCPREDCPDPGHQEQKRKKLSSSKDQAILHTILTRNQTSADSLGSDCAVVDSYTNEDIKNAQHRDSDLSRFISLFEEHTEKPPAKKLAGESSEVRILCSLWKQFKLVDEILYRVGKTDLDTWRLVIPRSIRSKILAELHDSKWAGHPGMSRMKASIGLRFYWPRMRDDIESWVKCCRSCAMNKRGHGRGKAPLIQELSGSPFQRVAFDVIGPIPTTKNGKRFILVVVDYYTKWAEAYDLVDHKASTVANTIIRNWIAHHGVPMRLHCDNAPEFRGHVLKQVKEMLGVKGTFTTPYRPQSNGLCERTNQTIEAILRTLVRENREQWDEVLSFALMAYRATPHTTTGFSPNMLVYGRENTMPCDIMYGQTGALYNKRHGCYCEYVDELKNNMVAAYVRARQSMGVAASRQKVYHDEDTVMRFFKPGDWVLYWNKPKSLKTLSCGWTGPYVVVKKLNFVDYLIKFSPDGKEKVVHCDDLQLDPCDQSRNNWIRDQIARQEDQDQDRIGIDNNKSIEIPDTSGPEVSNVVDSSSTQRKKLPRQSVTKITSPVKTFKSTGLRRSSRLADKIKRLMISLLACVN